VITHTLPDLNSIKPLDHEPEYEMSAPPSACGIALPGLSVTQSEGNVSLTWDDDAPSTDTTALVHDMIEGFVASARKMVARFPDNPRANTNLASALIKLGELSEAVMVLRKAVAGDPTDELATLTLSDALVKSGQTDEAAALLRALHQHRPDNMRARFALANIALRQHSYDEAKHYLLFDLPQHKVSARVQFLLGVIELNAGRLSHAVGALRKATHIEVKNPLYHHTLGVAYALQKHYDSAQTALRAALSLSPRSFRTVHALANVLLDSGNAEEAIKLLSSHTEIDFGNIERLELLARAYAAVGRHGMARSIAKGILQESGSLLALNRKVRLLNAIAESFMAENQPKEAEIALRRAIDLGPNSSAVPYENLASIYIYHLEQPEESISWLKKARHLFPEAQRTAVLLAIALASCNEAEAAFTTIMPLWHSGSAELPVYVCLGWLYDLVGNRSAAEAVLREGVQKFPGSLSLINNLAYTLLMSGQVTNAQHVLETIPKGSTPHPELIATWGLLHLWQGNENEGRRFYEEAEKMASERGNRLTAKRARQKKHLEVARMFLRAGNNVAAEAEIHQGLAVKKFPLSFHEELQQLQRNALVCHPLKVCPGE
jgi:predicted Zn-dependent protease